MRRSNLNVLAAGALAQELFAPLGQITLKRLFGGAGIYCDGLFFALIHDDAIYLKVTPETAPLFRAAGAEPFVYSAANRAKPVQLSYWTLPSEALDDPELALLWGRRALTSARQTAVAKAAKTRRKQGEQPQKSLTKG